MTDTAAAPVKRTRKTLSFAEKKAELVQKLADLQAKEAKKALAEKIKAGECEDPKAAQLIVTETRYLAAARSTIEKYGIATPAKMNEVMAALDEALTAAVG